MRTSVLRPGLNFSAFAPIAAAPLAGDDYECRGPLGAVTVDGDLIVPDDATCTLDRTRVRGNVVVKSRATLRATGVKVRGGVQSEGAASVVLEEATIAKDVQLSKGEPDGAVTISACQLKGNVQLEANRGPITVEKSRIAGSLQLSKNTGGIALARNHIGNTLQAQDNDPPPVGEGNAAREKKGQCKKMARSAKLTQDPVQAPPPSVPR